MIKRNPYYKTTASTKRIKEVKDLLADAGMRLHNDRDSEEFQVYPIGDVRGGKRTYFTSDRSAEGLEDALQTGLDMARRIKKEKVANPRKCRTFQVKRKIGKRTIQVKRKICRNPKKSEIKSSLLDLKDNKYYLFIWKEESNYPAGGQNISYNHDIVKWNSIDQKELAGEDYILTSYGEIIPHSHLVDIKGPFSSKYDATEWLGG